VQELRRQGHNGRLVAGSTIADPELPRLMGAAGDRTTIPTTFYGALDDRTKKFEAEFIQRAKAAGIDRTAAAQFDAATYDIVLIYAQVMKTAQVIGDPAKLAAVKPAYVIEMKDNKWHLLAHYPAGG
jgi:branched-chain amino acid transport system substrate-binding protein